MRHTLPAFALLALLAHAAPADARGRNGYSTYDNHFPRCGSTGCVARHERAIRVGPRDRGFASRSFRATGARSRY